MSRRHTPNAQPSRIFSFLSGSIALFLTLTAGAQVTPERPSTLDAPRILPWTLAGGFPGTADAQPRPRPRGSHVRVYDNTSMQSLFLADVQPHRAGDDGSFTPGPASADPAYVDTVEFGMYVNPGANGEADFDAYCLFYDTIDPDAAPVNQGFIGGFFIEVRGVRGDVPYTTGPIDLTPLFPDGIFFPNHSWFVDLRFYEPGSTEVLSGRATPMFSGTGATIGTGEDVYWRDVNSDGHYDPDEARFFGGVPTLANFFIALDGTIVTPICPCDFNDDHFVNSQDFFDFIVAFFELTPAADFNGDGFINSQDFFDFLGCFFEGCP